jgi:hypothetical protein
MIMIQNKIRNFVDEEVNKFLQMALVIYVNDSINIVLNEVSLSINKV